MLSVPPRYQPAVLQVFGRTLLCKDMDVALAASKAADCNCVTIDGDQVSFTSLQQRTVQQRTVQHTNQAVH